MIGGGSGYAVFVAVLSQGRFSEANHRHCEVPQWPLNHIRWIGGSSIDFLIGLTAHCMRGQTAIPVFFRSGLRATFFLRTKKEGKGVPRGPLGTPDAGMFRAIVGFHNGGGRPQSLPVQRALQGPVRSSL